MVSVTLIVITAVFRSPLDFSESSKFTAQNWHKSCKCLDEARIKVALLKEKEN